MLEHLADALGETAHLAVLEGSSVRYLDAVESSRALRVASRTGSVLAASCTASGKALLAELPDAEVSALFADQAALPRLVVSAPVSRMTEETAEKFKNELREQAAWLEDQLPGATE